MTSAASGIHKQRMAFNGIMPATPPGTSFGKLILLPKTQVSTKIISRLSFILFKGDMLTVISCTVIGDIFSSLQVVIIIRFQRLIFSLRETRISLPSCQTNTRMPFLRTSALCTSERLLATTTFKQHIDTARTRGLLLPDKDS